MTGRGAYWGLGMASAVAVVRHGSSLDRTWPGVRVGLVGLPTCQMAA